MRGHKQRTYSWERLIASEEEQIKAAQLDLAALTKCDWSANSDYYQKSKDNAEQIISSCTGRIKRYKQNIAQNEANQNAEKEIEKWKKSLKDSKESSKDNSKPLKKNQLLLVLNSSCFTTYSKRFMKWLKEHKLMRLIIWIVVIEILWYLPKFINLLLVYLSRIS